MRPVAILALSGALAAAAWTGAAQARAPAASLCRTDEARVFACPIGRKLVSICGQGPSAVYRFGRPGRVEMEARGPTTSQEGYSGGGEAQVAFKSHDYTYVVYDRVVRTRFSADGRHDPAFSQGLLVVKDGHVLADHACRAGGDTGLSSKGVEGMAPGPSIDH